MARRPLPGLRWPLPEGRWPWLCCETGAWQVSSGVGEAQALARVDVVWDLGDRLYLRLRWPRAGSVKEWIWPRQCHVWLARDQLPAQWSLLRAHLWPGRRRHWLGAP